jgi:hypothetical protein
MTCVFFPVEAGRLMLVLNSQQPFEDTARLLLGSSCGPDALISSVVLLLQVHR